MIQAMKRNLYALTGCAAAGLKAVQGYAHDLSQSLTLNSPASINAYGLGEVAKTGSAISGGICLGEVLGKLEVLARIPKSVRGLAPMVLATAGAGTAISACGNNFGFHDIMDSTRRVISSYQESLSQVVNFKPDFDPYSLTGAVTVLHSLGRLTVGNLSNLVKSANRKEMQESQTEAQGETA